MVSQIESPSLIVASFSILLLLLSSLATTMASTTEAATASTSSHTQKKEHGKETFFFSLPLKLLLLAGRRVFRRCRCRRRRAAKRRASWLALAARPASVSAWCRAGGGSGLTTTIDHLGCRLLTSHSPKVSRANVANRHHFSSIPSHTVPRPVSIFKTRNSTNVL